MSDTPQDRSLAAFLAAQAEFDLLLGQLRDISENYFDTDPNRPLWDDAARVGRWNGVLRTVVGEAKGEA